MHVRTMRHREDRYKGSRSVVHGVWRIADTASRSPVICLQIRQSSEPPSIYIPVIIVTSGPRVENTNPVLEAASALDFDMNVFRYREIVKACVQRFHAYRTLIGSFV
jgi:hypothetical protein